MFIQIMSWAENGPAQVSPGTWSAFNRYLYVSFKQNSGERFRGTWPSCLCVVFLMLLRLFIAALWSPAGKGLTSRFLLVMFIVVLLLFPCGIPGQMWYLIVSLLYLCRLFHFY